MWCYVRISFCLKGNMLIWPSDVYIWWLVMYVLLFAALTHGAIHMQDNLIFYGLKYIHLWNTGNSHSDVKFLLPGNIESQPLVLPVTAKLVSWWTSLFSAEGLLMPYNLVCYCLVMLYASMNLSIVALNNGVMQFDNKSLSNPSKVSYQWHPVFTGISFIIQWFTIFTSARRDDLMPAVIVGLSNGF